MKWDWLTLAAAAFIFMLIVASWGISYRAFDELPMGLTHALYLMFALVLGGMGDFIPAHWKAIVGFVIMLALIAWRDRRLHRVAVPTMFVLLCYSTLPRRLLGD